MRDPRRPRIAKIKPGFAAVETVLAAARLAECQRRARPSNCRTRLLRRTMIRCGLRPRSVTASSMRLIERRLSRTSASTLLQALVGEPRQTVGDRRPARIQRVGDLLEGLQRLAGFGHHALGLARAKQVSTLARMPSTRTEAWLSRLRKLVRVD